MFFFNSSSWFFIFYNFCVFVFQTSLTDASQYLNGALDGRAFFRSATILFPSSWKGDCGQVVQPANGEMATRADVRITPPHLLFSDALWTQQSQGCCKPGDFISLAYTRLINPAQQPGELGEHFSANKK